MPITALHRDQNGALRYTPSLGEEAQAELRGLAGGEVTHLGHGVYVAGGNGHNLQVIQPDVQSLDGALVDIAGLISPIANAKPIVFFKPEYKRGAVHTPTELWFNSLASLGYDIRIATSLNELTALLALSPDIVCFSAMGMQMGHVQVAFWLVKENLPHAVTILGGKGAVPEAAHSFDIVVTGEADITFPRILQVLQRHISSGSFRASHPVPLLKKFPDLSDLVNPDVKGLVNRAFWTPPLAETLVQDLTQLSATRYLGRGNDQSLPIDFSTSVFVRTETGIVSPQALVSADFPIRIATPEPLSEAEIDILSQRLATPIDPNVGLFYIYAQRGCLGKGRCLYCSVDSTPGRHPSVSAVMNLLRQAADAQVEAVALIDDNFFSNSRWASELLDGIEAEGLNKRLQFLVAIRSDTPNYPLVRRILDLGFAIEAGTETLDAQRAERMGKVKPGQGEEYVRRTRAFFDFVGSYVAETHRPVRLHIYSLNTFPGEGLSFLARELSLQLKESARLLKTHGFTPIFENNPTTKPTVGDRQSVSLAGGGMQRAFAPPSTPFRRWVRLGNVVGGENLFGFSEIGGRLSANVVFGPTSFAQPQGVDDFERVFSYKRNEAILSGEPPAYSDAAKSLLRFVPTLPPELASPLKAEVRALVAVLETGVEKRVWEYVHRLGEAQYKLTNARQTEIRARRLAELGSLEREVRNVIDSLNPKDRKAARGVLREIRSVRAALGKTFFDDIVFVPLVMHEQNAEAHKRIALLKEKIARLAASADPKFALARRIAAENFRAGVDAADRVGSSAIAGAAVFLTAREIIGATVTPPQGPLGSLFYGYDILGAALVLDQILHRAAGAIARRGIANALISNRKFGLAEFTGGLGVSLALFRAIDGNLRNAGVSQRAAEIAGLVGTGAVMGASREIAPMLARRGIARMLPKLIPGLGQVYAAADFAAAGLLAVIDAVQGGNAGRARDEWYERTSHGALEIVGTIIPPAWRKLAGMAFGSERDWMKWCELRLDVGEVCND